ncbi:MAG: RraA family protein [Pseudomonadota bacterium]
MVVRCYDVEIPRLSAADLVPWAEIPAAVASDCLERGQAMAGAISPLTPSMRIVGQARTVACMVGDNSALHAAIGRCAPGDVIICDGQRFEDAALFGGLLTRSAREAGVAGLVIDGAVRDSEEIIEDGFPCFSRAVVPRGPHKGFGGSIDGPVSCGGVAVAPGDLILGDADGVTVVPFARIGATLEAAHAILAKEARALESLAAGGSLAEVYGVPDVTMVDPN